VSPASGGPVRAGRRRWSARQQRGLQDDVVGGDLSDAEFVEDDESIEPKSRQDYVWYFKAHQRKTALSSLQMSRVVYEADKTKIRLRIHRLIIKPTGQLVLLY
jgi:ubiquinone biosynthesis protein COQ9